MTSGKLKGILYYSKKECSNPSFKKKKSLEKNLLVFLRLHKDSLVSFLKISGIKFLISFSNILRKSIFCDHLRYHLNLDLKFTSISPITSIARFYPGHNKLNMSFFENIEIENINVSKIYLEESLDEIKTYLDEKLILLALKSNPIVGNCWLGIESSSSNNRNFWFQVISSSFNFMTKVESTGEKTIGYKNFDPLGQRYQLKDSEFEYLGIFEKNNINMFRNFQNKNYSNDIIFLSKHYQSSKIKNYLKTINWKNRVFMKKKIQNNNIFFKKKRFCKCAELLIY